MGEIVRRSNKCHSNGALLTLLLQDLDKEDDIPLGLVAPSTNAQAKAQYEKRKAAVLRQRYGFSAEGQEGDQY